MNHCADYLLDGGASPMPESDSGTDDISAMPHVASTYAQQTRQPTLAMLHRRSVEPVIFAVPCDETG